MKLNYLSIYLYIKRSAKSARPERIIWRCLAMTDINLAHEKTMYTQLAQRVRVMRLAARCDMYFHYMLAELKGDREILTNTSISYISK